MEPLSAAQGRVVAALVEKALATPQHYPLTLHALVAACNQSTNREPVTSYREEEVQAALDALRELGLVRAVLPSHGRSVVRYRHVLDERLGLDAPQLAVLAVLELRGPQTAAELRTRTERLAAADAVDHELELLRDRPDPLVVRLARRPGQKEERWAALLGPAARAAAPDGRAPQERGATPRAGAPPHEVGPLRAGASGRPPPVAPVAAGEPPGFGEQVDALRARTDALRAELEALAAEVDGLRRAVAELRSAHHELRASLGG